MSNVKLRAKDKRATFLALADEVDTQLCTFCKFYEGSGCAAGGCHHPLCDRTWSFPGNDGELYPGDDCWGFRPKLSVSDCADIVGIVLANHWVMWAWWEEGDGIKIAGSTKDEGWW